jgi:transposase
MSKAYPNEFRDDVVEVAQRREAGVTIKEIADDFGISEAYLQNWLRKADVESGRRAGVSVAESSENHELRRRNRLLERENEVLRRAAAYLSQANLPGKGSTRS